MVEIKLSHTFIGGGGDSCTPIAITRAPKTVFSAVLYEQRQYLQWKHILKKTTVDSTSSSGCNLITTLESLVFKISTKFKNKQSVYKKNYVNYSTLETAINYSYTK